MGCIMAGFDFQNLIDPMKVTGDWGAQVGSYNPTKEADFFSGLRNLFTGNLDYARDLEKLGMEMKFNSAEAQKNREWQTYMSNSAYQRAKEDMLAAGLNPYLAVMSGNAASTGSSSPASIGSAPAPRSGQGIAGIFKALLGAVVGMNNSAIQQSIAQSKSTTELTKALINANSAQNVADTKALASLDVARIYRGRW